MAGDTTNDGDAGTKPTTWAEGARNNAALKTWDPQSNIQTEALSVVFSVIIYVIVILVISWVY